MSNKIKPEIIDNSNEMINIIDEAITKNYLKYYEYNHFYNIQEIGFRRNQSDNSKKYLLVMEYADDGTTHHLNSNNVLVRQGIIKLSDFGLSKGIEGSFNLQSKLFDMVVYVDPKVFDQIRYNYYQLQTYSLNKRSDIYSIGILLWELTSGHPPFVMNFSIHPILIWL
ncbi:kinase-like domain-containing protein [Rhizophagus irregularis DAOM 181602=DAOM 197198]|nr:kinase-like domain-containing protein [Rhizophagus irregularis DAOM 181602=DAOM 197198]